MVFEDSLVKNFEYLLINGTILVRSRLSLLLGYYADMIFKTDQEKFKTTIRFLIESMNMTGNELCIAKQSADTMNTITSDLDLYNRLKHFVVEFLPTILEMTKTVKIALYFEFVSDLVRQYTDEIGQGVTLFVQAMVDRILVEIQVCHQKKEKNNLIMSKCWSVIQCIVLGSKAYIPLYQD